MPLISRTVLDRREILSDGTIQIRLAKQIVNDDGVILSSGFHRASFFPGCNISASIAAINENLQQLGFPPISTDDLSKVTGLAEQEWTPNVLAAYAAAVTSSQSNHL